MTTADAAGAGGVPGGPTDPGPLGARAARGFGWSFISFGSTKIVAFVVTLVLARLLGPAEFGLVAAGLTLVSYFEVALDLGLGAALVYEQEEGLSRRVQTAFTVNLVIALLLTAISVLLAPVVAAAFHLSGHVELFRALFLYLLFRGAGQVQDAVFKRDLDFRRRTLVTVASGLLRGVLSVGLAYAGYGAWAVVWGLLVGQLFLTLATSMLLRFRPLLLLDRGAVRGLLRYGLKYLSLKVLDALGENVDYVVVGVQLGAAQLGLYYMAYRLPELVIANAFWIFSGVAFAIYSRARADGPAAFRAFMLRILTLTTLFGFTAGVGLALVARDAVLVLFSARWDPAVAPMALIALAIGVSSIGYASGDIFPAIGRPGLLLAATLPATAVEVVAFVLAARYGIVAVASVHLGFNCAFGVVRLLIADHVVGTTLGQCLRAMRPSLCTAAGVAALGLPVRLVVSPGLPALVAIVAAGTLGGVAALRLSSPDTYAELRGWGTAALRR